MSNHISDHNRVSQIVKAYCGGVAALLRPRNIRASAAYAHDVLMTGIAFVVAIYLQAGWEFVAAFDAPLWKGILCYALVSAGTFSFPNQQASTSALTPSASWSRKKRLRLMWRRSGRSGHP